MRSNCLNCGEVLSGKYCANCGQRSDVKKLNWHSFAEEVFHFFTHIEKGFLKTTTTLVIKPGTLFKSYLDGKRKIYHKPVSFFLIWIAIYLIVRQIALSLTNYPDLNTESAMTFGAKGLVIINKYRSIIDTITIPFTAFVAWVFVARPKLNYIEVFSISFYMNSFVYMVLTIQFIVCLLLNWNFRVNLFTISTLTIYTAWVFYAAYDFYSRYNIRFLILRMLLGTIVTWVVYFILVKLLIRLFIVFQFD